MTGRGSFVSAAMVVAAVAALTPGAIAAGPAWGPPRVVDTTADVGRVLVRGNGDVVVVQSDDKRVVMRVKRAGAAGFGAPIVVHDRTAIPYLAGNERGATALLFDESSCPPVNPENPCSGDLTLRFAEAGRPLGPPQKLALPTPRVALAVGNAGHAGVAWQTGNLLSDDSSIQVALRPKHGPLGAPITVSRAAQGQANEPSVAVNGKGEVAVAWTQWDGHRSSVMVAEGTVRRGFGPPEVVYTESSRALTAGGAKIALADDGEATVLFDADSKRAAIKPADSDSFRDSFVISGGGGPGELLANRSGAMVALWTGSGSATSFAAAKRVSSFGPAIKLGAGNVAWASGALDSHGNLAAAGITGPGTKQIPYAATFSRFGFAPEAVTPALGPGVSGIEGVASNDAGQVAALFSTFPAHFRPGTTTLSLVERPADSTAPQLVVRSLKVRRGRAYARVACRGERCRISGRIRLRGVRIRGAASASRSTKPLAPGTTGRLSFALTRRARTKVRRALKRGHRVRARLVLRAVDAAGNPRERGRAVRARRLLR